MLPQQKKVYPVIHSTIIIDKGDIPLNEWLFISQKFSDHHIISHASIHSS